MLTVSDLHVRYGSIAALHGVSIEVNRGETVSVVGQNGAGKSTLLGTIAGGVSPSGGEVEFDGHDITGARAEDIVRRGLAFVPEGRHIFHRLTVDENLLLGATTRTLNRDTRAHIDELKQRFPVLGARADSRAGQLSGGEQQMLAIARSLIARPKLLLLDEPSLGLAPAMVNEVFAVLGELREEEVTVLLVEQNARRAVAFADRTYVLRTGRIEATGTWNAVDESEEFARAYFGSESFRVA